jgi:hypothetical protein
MSFAITEVCQACGLSSVAFSTIREAREFTFSNNAKGMSCRYCGLKWTERYDSDAINRARKFLRGILLRSQGSP